MAEKSTGQSSGEKEAALEEPEAQLTLFSTSACHLCELAEALLMPWVARGWVVCVEDISESDELFHRYGLLIPMLRRHDTGAELRWPFDAEGLAAFLG